MILVCQAMYGVERGKAIQAIVEDATGEDCPCVQGRRCPLLGAGVVPSARMASAAS